MICIKRDGGVRCELEDYYYYTVLYCTLMLIILLWIRVFVSRMVLCGLTGSLEHILLYCHQEMTTYMQCNVCNSACTAKTHSKSQHSSCESQTVEDSCSRSLSPMKMHYTAPTCSPHMRLLQRRGKLKRKLREGGEEKGLMRRIHQLCHGFVGSKNQGWKELMMRLVEAACSPC